MMSCVRDEITASPGEDAAAEVFSGLILTQVEETKYILYHVSILQSIYILHPFPSQTFFLQILGVALTFSQWKN